MVYLIPGNRFKCDGMARNCLPLLSSDSGDARLPLYELQKSANVLTCQIVDMSPRIAMRKDIDRQKGRGSSDTDSLREPSHCPEIVRGSSG